MARVIFADDDARNRFVIAEHLRLMGHQVRVAANGAEAVELVDQELPDVLVLDLMMPEMDGFEACRMLRSRTRTHDLRIVAVTALDSLERCAQGKGTRFDGVLTKPFRMQSLLDMLHEPDELAVV